MHQSRGISVPLWALPAWKRLYNEGCLREGASQMYTGVTCSVNECPTDVFGAVGYGLNVNTLPISPMRDRYVITYELDTAFRQFGNFSV